jgi:hypothetical protein
MPTFILFFKAPNDTNGNPRRAWVRFEDGLAVESWSDNYDGIHAVSPHDRAMAAFAPAINVTASELRSWIKAAKGNGLAR